MAIEIRLTDNPKVFVIDTEIKKFSYVMESSDRITSLIKFLERKLHDDIKDVHEHNSIFELHYTVSQLEAHEDIEFNFI